MSSPRNLKELRSLPGRLQPLISKARTRCQSFSRQDANFVWRPKHKEKGFSSSNFYVCDWQPAEVVKLIKIKEINLQRKICITQSLLSIFISQLPSSLSFLSEFTTLNTFFFFRSRSAENAPSGFFLFESVANMC